MSKIKKFVDIDSLKIYDTLLKIDMDKKIKSGISASISSSASEGVQDGDNGFTTGEQVYDYIEALSISDTSISSLFDDEEEVSEP